MIPRSTQFFFTAIHVHTFACINSLCVQYIGIFYRKQLFFKVPVIQVKSVRA